VAAAHPESLTELLRESSGGNREAFDRLLPVVYQELKAMAHNRLRSERGGHTLDTTALVHETYLKLAQQDRIEWQSRSHFFAVGSQAMRRVLVDYARARNAARRGGTERHLSLDVVEKEAAELLSERTAADLLALDEALDDLSRFDERAATVVEYRFFGGLTHDEIAHLLGVSTITVRRAWTSARAWLRRELGTEPTRPILVIAEAGRDGP